MADARANILITAEDRTQAAFDSVARSFDQLKKIGAAALGGEFFKKVIESGSAAEQSANRLTAAYRLQGAQVGITRAQLDDLADSMAATTQFSDNELKRGESELLKFGNIYGDVFKRAMQASVDLAAFTGGDVVGAFDAVGKALANPIDGMKGLGAAVGKLSAAERDHIKTLVEQGKGLEAQNFVLDTLQKHIGGTAQQMNSGYLQAINDSAKAWDKFKEALAGILALHGVTDIINEIAAAMRGLTSVLQGGSFSEGVLGKQLAMAKQITELRDQIGVSDKRQGLTFTDDEGRVIGEDLRIDDLKKKLQDLEAEYKKLYQTQAAAPSAAGKVNLGMTLEQLAFIKSLKHQTESVGDGPIGGLFAKAEELHLGEQTNAMIQKLGGAIQQEADQADRARDSNEAWKKAFAFTEDQRNDIIDIELRTKNLTAMRDEAELNTAQQRMDIEIRRAAIGMTDEQSAAFKKQANLLEDDYIKALQHSQNEARKWQTGFAQAMNNVTDYATNTAEQVKGLFENAFKGMEDALVSFVKTGKLDFRSLADSIITDIIRIRIQQSIIAPLSGAASGAAGTAAVSGFLNFFGISNSPTGTVNAGAASYGPTSSGGVPHYAAGTPFVPNDGLAFLHRGEQVIPANRNGAGGTFFIDARGADSAGMARLEGMIRQLGGSIEPRAVAAVAQARQRGAAGLR